MPQRPLNLSCKAFEELQDTSEFEFRRVFSGLDLREPIFLRSFPLDNGRFVSIERNGRILTWKKSDGSDVTILADLTNQIESDISNEGGLLGFAFDPNFSINSYVYLSYTIPNANLANNLISVVARTTMNTNSLTMSTNLEPVMTVIQPYRNHNGGMIEFGPDGYLYIGFGDGGSSGDPLGNSQNMNSLLGKILRIDVTSLPYQIPLDNPFADIAGVRSEIWASGIRNPWRFSFDRATDDLWMGDVGQGAFEEVDIVVKGGNYGWNIREAASCYEADECNAQGLTDPVWSYPRSEGQSITGGYVYRGTQLPELQGSYVVGDFASGNIWKLKSDSKGKLQDELIIRSSFGLSSFAEDSEGEIYALDYFSGSIHKLVAKNTEQVVVKAPDQLSKTGCFDSQQPNEPLPALIPYEVNSELWSDNADKKRWFALPDGEVISFNEEGKPLFPNGTVLVKEFTLQGKKVETRFLVKHQDESWSAVTYAWNSEGTDANLLEEGEVRLIGDQQWSYPSVTACFSCHNKSVDFSIGFEIRQLNRPILDDYNKIKDQLSYFADLGVVKEAVSPQILALKPLTSIKSLGSLEHKSRSYLHSNCSFCHNPSGPVPVYFDLRFQTDLQSTKICDVASNIEYEGLTDPKILKPGSAAQSILTYRMNAKNQQRMPPLASLINDDSASNILAQWIDSLSSCEN